MLLIRLIGLLAAVGVLGAACDSNASDDVHTQEKPEPAADSHDWRLIELVGFETLRPTELQLSLAYCGSSYRVEVKEASDAVTIRAETSDPIEPHAPDCASLARADLEQPLEGRRVIDAATGEYVRQV